ncbi:MAG TPA: hypothetical protein PK405_09375 [Hyphomicrobiales bacterium]|nr:hypothetical protein [Rhodobiaceae bacterium]HXK54883.1 hypothetical protein [Hyphomicrobiales bacterium]
MSPKVRIAGIPARWILSACVLLAAAPAARANEVLDAMAGEWIGKGDGRIGPGEPAEKIYCKISNTLSDGGKALLQAGRCAVGNTTGALEGRIEAGENGQFGGKLVSPVMKAPATVSGSGDKKQLRLNARYVDSRTGRQISSDLEFEIVADGEFRMTTTATDLQTGDVYRSGEVVFRRQ